MYFLVFMIATFITAYIVGNKKEVKKCIKLARL